MIRREFVRHETIDAFHFISEFLSNRRDYYFTTEEIYKEVPTDEHGLPLITISAIEKTLSHMAHYGDIEMYYVRGVRHFAHRDKQY